MNWKGIYSFPEANFLFIHYLLFLKSFTASRILY